MRKQLRSVTPRPKDFLDFWQKTLAELKAIPFALTRERMSTRDSAQPRLEHISFDSLWRARIHGYFLRPANGEDRPLVG